MQFMHYVLGGFMYLNEKIVIGKNNGEEFAILPKMANRHGIITGASGSGKTTTVKVGIFLESLDILFVPPSIRLGQISYL